MMQKPSWLSLPPMAFAILVVLPLTIFITDRTPPYERLSGTVAPAPPEVCHLDAGSPQGVVPGACVIVDWVVRPIRECRPAPGFNVTRHLVTSNGNRILLGQARSEYPQRGEMPGSSTPLTRHFVLPANVSDGTTIYEASARFVCNPLQELVSKYITSAMDIVIDTPSVAFHVTRPISSRGAATKLGRN